MDSQRIESLAADWLARRDGDSWTPADEAAFGAWQGEAMAHRVAVVRLRSVWGQADRLQALGAGVAVGEIPKIGRWRLSSFDQGAERWRLRRAHVALAAGLVLALALGGYWGRQRNVYRTAVGDTQAVRLADGSQVTLNTDSRIHVAISEAERRIELDRGEAFFDVAQDPARPFVVRAGNKRIVAVGTQFSVLRNGEAVRVVVTQGRVRMENVQLDAGRVAQVGAAGVVVKSVGDAEKYVTWREGFLAFHDTPLIEAVAEFNRYHEKKLVVADPKLADLRVGGNLRTRNMEAFVRVLEEGFPVKAREEEDKILLTGRE